MNKAVQFHPGELYFQKVTGVESQVASLAPRLILDYLPGQHREFYSNLSHLFVASIDKYGQPWASILTGESGFINVIDERLVCINAKPVSGDPLNDNLKLENHLGFLGLDFENRRRNRMSGQVKYRSAGEIVFNVNKAFGNCPKYIQTRKLNSIYVNNKENTKSVVRFEYFDDNIQKFIASSDTFFIASYYSQLEHRGADVSHRGGVPGFVRIINESILSFDDYSGNNLFMTLGNLQSNPVAGLLFINFETGDILQLACETKIIDTPTQKYARRIQLSLKYGWLFKSALSIDSEFLEYSPFLK